MCNCDSLAFSNLTEYLCWVLLTHPWSSLDSDKKQSSFHSLTFSARKERRQVFIHKPSQTEQMAEWLSFTNPLDMGRKQNGFNSLTFSAVTGCSPWSLGTLWTVSEMCGHACQIHCNKRTGMQGHVRKVLLPQKGWLSMVVASLGEGGGGKLSLPLLFFFWFTYRQTNNQQKHQKLNGKTGNKHTHRW